jgi:ERCC4-type nuclease
MIRVAKDTGSIELLPLLQKLGAPAEKANLHFADFAFQGEGTDGSPIPIGVERKTLGDFVSSILNGRLPGHQLPGMLKCYQEIWIVLEGEWRISKYTGHVQTLQWQWATGDGVHKKKWVDIETGLAYALGYQELESMIVTLEMRGGVRIRRTRDQMETARFVKALFHWWVDKSFAQHRSHLKFHSQFADQGLLTKPSLCRVIAAQLPGIGFEKSGKVAAHFGSVAAMVEASEKEWEKVDGIGSVLAKRIVEKLVVAGATV